MQDTLGDRGIDDITAGDDAHLVQQRIRGHERFLRRTTDGSRGQHEQRDDPGPETPPACVNFRQTPSRAASSAAAGTATSPAGITGSEQCFGQPDVAHATVDRVESAREQDHAVARDDNLHQREVCRVPPRCAIRPGTPADSDRRRPHARQRRRERRSPATAPRRARWPPDASSIRACTSVAQFTDRPGATVRRSRLARKTSGARARRRRRRVGAAHVDRREPARISQEPRPIAESPSHQNRLPRQSLTAARVTSCRLAEPPPNSLRQTEVPLR